MNLHAAILFLSTLLSIGFTAFFTAAETAIISADKVELSRLKKLGNRKAGLVIKYLENIDRLLTTTQFGANLAIALTATLGTIFVHEMAIAHEFLVLIVIAPFLLIFSDSLPKVIARYKANTMSLKLVLPLALFSRTFSPIISLLSIYTSRFSALLGIAKQDTLSRRKRVREELHALLQDNDRESEVRHGHKRIIRKILDFSQQNVKKVMLPLVNVDAIEKSETLQTAINMFETLRHSRLPVYEERIDNIVGILYFPDVFNCKEPSEDLVSEVMRPALFVPEYQQVESLTKEMKSTGAEMVIAVDEYGGAVGIVTREDVLEEIVGDISDEWDDHDFTMLELSPNTYLVHVKMGINELNERLEIKLPKGEYETLSGFLLQQFNRIPTAGDELYYGNLRIRVHRANEKSIETVTIEVSREDAGEKHE